jgi:hypothetical protein
LALSRYTVLSCLVKHKSRTLSPDRKVFKKCAKPCHRTWAGQVELI